MMPRDNYIGKKIGNYCIEKWIASGSFGTVYRARHYILNDRIVAIKILHFVPLGSDTEKVQFDKEARILEKLRGFANILPLMDVGTEDDVPYMVTEYMEQGSLRMRIQQNTGHLPFQEALKIIEQVGKGLQYAHDKRIVHRDLKPENILFNAKGEALLADFGIATILSTANIKRTHVIGTVAYMAPEQFHGLVCTESDQYALACITYELLTGHRVFEVDFHSMSHYHIHEPVTPPSQLNPQIPISVEQALLKALSKEHTKRYLSVSEFVAALTRDTENTMPHPAGSQTDPHDNAPEKPAPKSNDQSLLSSPPIPRPRKLRISRRSSLLIALITIVVLLSIFLSQVINHPLLPPIQPTPIADVPGISIKQIEGEDIGISDGRYFFDTNRRNQEVVALKREASESLKNGDREKALAKWNAAHEKDTNDAETLIYAENQQVKTSDKYITVVLGIALNMKKDDGFSRDALQAAYIRQKEYNADPQLAGGKKLRLLIANSGSNADRSKDIAEQIVQAAQHDKTIVGVQGWTTSERTLKVVKILADAHLPIVAADTASDELTGISPYFFRVGLPSSVSAHLTTTYIEKQLKSQRLVILRDPNEQYSRDTSARLGEQFAKDGYKIASIEDFKTDEDAKDGKLAQQVQKALITHKPELFYIATNTVGDVITLLNAIPQNSEYAGIKVFAGGAGYELVQNLDKITGYTRMLLSSSAFPDAWKIAELAQRKPEPPFFKDYITAYDPHDQHMNSPYMYRRANGGIMQVYDAVCVLLVASKMAVQQGKQNPTSEDIKNALSQVNGSQSFQGITGAISFDPKGTPIDKLHFILHVVDDRYLHVAAYEGCLLASPVCDDKNIHILE